MAKSGFVFLWSWRNEEHIGVHRVRVAEAEQVVRNARPPIPQSVGDSEPWYEGNWNEKALGADGAGRVGGGDEGIRRAIARFALYAVDEETTRGIRACSSSRPTGFGEIECAELGSEVAEGGREMTRQH